MQNLCVVSELDIFLSLQHRLDREWADKNRTIFWKKICNSKKCFRFAITAIKYF